MPEPESETRELLCKLNDTELLHRGDAMADAELRIEQIKLKRSEFGDKLKAERAMRRKLAGVIDSGEERRDVRCVWIEKFEQNCFELVRQDTGAVIDTRAMTAADRQTDMLDDEDPEGPIEDELDDQADDDPPARKNLDTEPDQHLDA